MLKYNIGCYLAPEGQGECNSPLQLHIKADKEGYQMWLRINIKQLEDKILNPLNDILIMAYGSEFYSPLEKEVRRIVNVLEKEQLIHQRL